MIEGHKTEKVVLSTSELRKDLLDRGLNRKELAVKYGIPVSQINRALKQAGLTGVRSKKIMFELQDDQQTQPQDEEITIHKTPVKDVE